MDMARLRWDTCSLAFLSSIKSQAVGRRNLLSEPTYHAHLVGHWTKDLLEVRILSRGKSLGRGVVLGFRKWDR